MVKINKDNSSSIRQSTENINFSSPIWLYEGKGAWHFVTIPPDLSSRIKVLSSGYARAWGSVPVNVTIGKISWKTSIFRDGKAQTYILPLKSDVRKAENLKVGDSPKIILEIKV